MFLLDRKKEKTLLSLLAKKSPFLGIAFIYLASKKDSSQCVIHLKLIAQKLIHGTMRAKLWDEK